MGVCTFLVSDQSKSYFDLGKFFMDEETVDAVKQDSQGVGAAVTAWLREDEYNHPLPLKEAETEAAAIAAWMKAHPDWRFLSDVDPEYDDVYLAVDAEDAEGYVEEFGEEGDLNPIYTKDGSIGAGNDDEDDSEEDDPENFHDPEVA